MKQIELELQFSVIIKQAIKYFLPVVLIIGAVFQFYFNSHIENEIALIKLKEVNHLETIRQTFNSTLENAISDTSVLAWHDDLLNLVGNDLSRGNKRESIVALENEFLKFLDKKKLYDQARLLDSKGMEIIRTNYHKEGAVAVSKDKLQLKANRYYFQKTISLEEDEIYISPFDLNIENGQIEIPLKPMIRFAVPIVDSNGIKHGIVILNYLGELLLNKIKGSLNVDSKTMLVNSGGYWLVGRTAEEEWGFMFDDRQDKTMVKTKPEVWKLLNADKDGQFLLDGTMYSFTTVFPYKTSFLTKGSDDYTEDYLKIISSIPVNHLNSQFSTFKNRLLTLFVFISLLFALISWLLALSVEKRKTATRDRELLIDQLQDALNNIKTLSGLVPICAKCKKIRDDKGYWNQIESYIEEHSEAQFSHGICQDCAEELYGDQTWYQKGKSDR